jgi:hypothetical protein
MIPEIFKKPNISSGNVAKKSQIYPRKLQIAARVSTNSSKYSYTVWKNSKNQSRTFPKTSERK